MGFQLPNPGVKSIPAALEGKILTSEPSGKSLLLDLFFFFLIYRIQLSFNSFLLTLSHLSSAAKYDSKDTE